jgi:hypothetical protein
MTTELRHVPQAVFGGDQFWRRLNQLADGLGHVGHQRWLIGDAGATDRYWLRCSGCDVAVVEIVVDREPEVAGGR